MARRYKFEQDFFLCPDRYLKYVDICENVVINIATVVLSITVISFSHERKPTVLTISGSLRANSSNAAVINIAAEYLADKVDFIVYNDLVTIRPFDDRKEPPEAVLNLRGRLKATDGIFICQPECTFGISGVLKNAIDWTVSSGEFVYKPTALVIAATGGDKAHASLLLTLTSLSANTTKECTLLISFVRSEMDDRGNVKDGTTISAIHNVIDALVDRIKFSQSF